MTEESSLHSEVVDLVFTPNPLAPKDPVLSSFFNGLIAEGGDVQDDLERDFGEVILGDTDSFQKVSEPLVEQLKARNVAQEDAGPRVRLAYETIYKTLDGLAPKLRSQDMGVYLYGSILYDDPNNLDPDIELFVEKRTNNSQEIGSYLGRYFDEQWHKVAGKYTGAHINTISMEEIDQMVQKINELDLSYIFDYCTQIDNKLGSLSVLLSGKALYSPSYEFEDRMRRRAIEIGTTVPIAGMLINRELNDALKTREMRKINARGKF